MRTTPAQHGRGSIRRPLQDVLREVLGSGGRALAPLLKPLAHVHFLLLEFSLVARQIEVQARKGDWQECPRAIRPLEFPVEIDQLFFRWKTFILAGVRVDLLREEYIVVTDTDISLQQTAEREDTNRLRAGDRGVHMYVQQEFCAAVAHFDP